MFSGGNSNQEEIDTVTISTTGDATDFGNLSVARSLYSGALSNGHGGL